MANDVADGSPLDRDVGQNGAGPRGGDSVEKDNADIKPFMADSENKYG